LNHLRAALPAVCRTRMLTRGARYNEELDAVNPEEVLEGCAVETVVLGLLEEDDVAGLKLELVHDPLAPGPVFNVFAPGLELSVPLIVGVLGVARVLGG
jgi:hypothetical protein